MKNQLLATMVVGFAALGVATLAFSMDDSSNGVANEAGVLMGHVELVVRDGEGSVIQYQQSDNIITNIGIQAISDLVLGTGHITGEGTFDTVIVGTASTADDGARVITDFTQASNRLIDEDNSVAVSGSNGGIIVALWDGDNDGGDGYGGTMGDDINNGTGTVTISQVGLTTGGPNLNNTTNQPIRVKKHLKHLQLLE